MKNGTRQTGRVICDFRLPNTFDTRLGERASANVHPCNSSQSHYVLVLCKKLLSQWLHPTLFLRSLSFLSLRQERRKE